ncbi:hypothetical protein PTKU15_85420 [Paraburkholderia terrae]|nr:hypothetical protein PTKU15_85420 [Paraburkholderia terrae]
MSTVGVRKPRDINSAKHSAVLWIADNGRGTCPPLHCHAKMLGAVNLHRLLQGKCGANRIRPTGAFCPAASRYQAKLPQGANDARVAREFENCSVRISQNQHGLSSAQKFTCLREKRPYRIQYPAVPDAQVINAIFIERRWTALGVRVDVTFQAPMPGSVNDRA